MAVHRKRTDLQKADVASSVDMYNRWFMQCAPEAYRQTRVMTADQVKNALALTENLTFLQPSILRQHPSLLAALRMATMPPIARDRLVEWADVPWIKENRNPTENEVQRGSTIIADRLCGAASDPIICNAQEKRQFQVLEEWLKRKAYALVTGSGVTLNAMAPGTFSFRLNVPRTQEGGKRIHMPIDAVVLPKSAKMGNFPLLIEAKSAGDYTKTNKRRKEEATKIRQLRNEYGEGTFVLLLCGNFDPGYPGYEASEGIDWPWEHGLDDLREYGV